MKRQHIIIIVAAAILLLMVGGGVLLYAVSEGAAIPGLSQPTPTPGLTFDIPQVEITPPPSLAEIAADIREEYPELADLLENPELGTVYKDFYLAYQNGGEEAALALARQRGMLNSNDEIMMSLVLDTEETTGLIAELEAEGVIVNGSYRNKINIAIPLDLIREQMEAEDPKLIVERISNLEHVIRLELPKKADPNQALIQGQGVGVTGAEEWHTQGYTGQGVKVGVLDLGFAGHEALLGLELPEEVILATFGDESELNIEVHGAACAEIVHEMAPGATLYLAYYDGSDVAMGLAVEWLIEQGVDIISNSTGSNGLTPMDGTGFSAEVVNMAHEAGIFWVNSAGNEADVHYQGIFDDSDNNNLHEFSAGVEGLPFIPFGPGIQTKIILNWDDWDDANQDYELLLLDQEGNLIAKSEDSQSGQAGQYPLEGFVYEFADNEIYLLAIENYEGQARGDALFNLFLLGGVMHPDFAVAEHSLGTPGDAENSFTVGAVHWADDALEPYSSQGPTTDGRIKPDMAAPAAVDSASYAPEAFDGTSASTPHVAGAAALVKQAFPDLSPDEIAAFLEERAIDLGPNGPDNAFGMGRLNLGEPPDTETQLAEAEATEPPPNVVIQPTSTPRSVGLPGQPVAGGWPEEGSPPPPDDGLLGMIVLIGMCLTGLGCLVLIVLLIVGIIFLL